MKLYKITLIIALLIFLFVLGCSDRGVNYGKDTYDLKEGTYVGQTGAHVFHQELLYQIQNKFQQMKLVGYLPKAAFAVSDGGEFKPVPLLVLLPPQEGDQYFYFQHGLKELADELISKGIIQPMAILCLPNDQIFGGYFFAGTSPAAGYYDDLIGDALITFAQEKFFATLLRSKAKRAIGGMGMGAYGAFRAAILHPDVFGAVSGVAGPLDFDGANGTSGLMDFFDDALAEQGLTSANNLKFDFDYTGNWPYSRLFVGGSIAFSIHDTAYTTTEIGFGGSSIEYRIDSKMSLDTTVFPLSSAIYYEDITEVPFEISSASTIQNPNYYFHLPFDNTGSVVQPVWDLWMQNNLSTLFSQNPNSLDGINVWIGNSTQATFGNFYQQTESWKNTLQAAPNVSVDEFNLVGYDNHPANRDQYVFDYLREMLIFHSEQFGN